MELDRRKDAPPLYIQVFKILSRVIEQGEYSTGELIPSEKQLQDMFSVSRMTIRLAVGELVNRSYVECMRGIGTVVTYGKIKENIQHVVSLTEEMRQQNIELYTTLCEIELGKATARAALALCIEPGSPVYILKRLRNVKGKPLVYSVTYLHVKDLPLDPQLYMESLYALLRDKFNIRIAHGEDVLEATLAEDTISKMLEVSSGYPIFKRTRTCCDQDNRPVEFSLCYYPGDKYKCSVSL